MTSLFLTSCTDFFLIRWIANILGFFLNLIYLVFDKVGICNIGLCIIVFTIVVKLLMLPMSIKQQKTMKLNSVITPEIQAIQKKYEGKRDNDSIMRQNAEINAVYQKYGTSPTGGCLQLFIQMPIMFALYAVIAMLPNHITTIEEMYNTGVVAQVIGEEGDGREEGYAINSLKDIYVLSSELLDEKTYKTDSLKQLVAGYLGNGKIEDVKSYNDDTKENVKNIVYESFTSAYSTVFGNASAWSVVEASYEQAQNGIDGLKALSTEEWETLQKKHEALYLTYSAYTDSDWDALEASYVESIKNIKESRSEIRATYSFFGIDLSISPAEGVKIAILIPILSALAQLLSMKISMANQQKTGNGTADSMMSSMKVMSYSMCFVSAFFCYTFPAGLGLYWVISSLVQCAIQVFLNKYFEKMDVDTIIKQNMEKVNKQRAKQGLAPNTISTAAATSTRNYAAQTSQNRNTVDMTNLSAPKKGSIAEKANLAKKYADKK